MSRFTFNAVSTVHKKRSFFDLSHGIKTSMSVGTLYPIECQEVLPGDTFKENENHVVRLSSSFIRPVMDNYWMDVYYFFVPSRIIYDDFVEVMGENRSSAWSSSFKKQNPTYTTKQTVTSKSVADYLGLPVGSIPSGINSLPFRAFAMVYDEWFRNENVIDPMLIQKGGQTTNEQLNSDPWSPSNYTGMPPKISKKKDYFTSCLPSPQKGSPVPVTTQAPFSITTTDESGLDSNIGRLRSLPTGEINAYYNAYAVPFNLRKIDGSLANGSDSHNLILPSSGLMDGSSIAFDGSTYVSSSREAVTNAVGVELDTLQAVPSSYSNVNDLRFAVQLQRMLELDARGGTRYREYLLAHYGVDNADARMQIPEFLGGKRTPLNTQQVAQTSQSTDSEALATLGAYSHSIGRSGYVKSFSEHGYVIKVAAIRTMHTYQQGISRMWSRLVREDYYDPLFAYLSEQPVYTSQIYAANQTSFKDNVFGYNEAWAEYRYAPSVVTGQMRTAATDSLDVYHFADNYANAPTLSKDFIEETPIFFDRTVAVSNESLDNFIVDFWFDERAWHVMPTYSTPGLIDHTY